MSDSLVERIAAAVLYEGYILYPYRASSPKNRERFTFGRVYPQNYSIDQDGAEPCVMQTECLARRTGDGASLVVRVRFLHAMAREIGSAPQAAVAGAGDFTVVPELRIDGQVFQTWHEATERDVPVPNVSLDAPVQVVFDFAFPGSQTVEPIQHREGHVVGAIRRRQDALTGVVEIVVKPLDLHVSKITVRVSNRTPITLAEMRDANTLLLRTFASTHAILSAHGAEFFSATDPPPDYLEAVAGCANIGGWPVLVGDEGKAGRATILASPIILYDYPTIAPESAGDFCDGTEIDEMLTLRVLTMTDDEKREMRGVDEFARRILERTESLGTDDRFKMHGSMRDVHFPGGDFFDENTRLQSAGVGGVPVKPGDRVRICPKSRADAIDMMLAGKIAIVEAIEQDAEARIHFALVIEDDPGRDLGMMRQPGHRFFYGAEEIELLPEDG